MMDRTFHSNFMFGLIVLFGLINNVVSSVLECYKCTVVPPGSGPRNQTVRLCADFDYSEKFIINCPYSTMCMKRSYEYPLLNGELIRGEERDCAHQKYDYRLYADGKWQARASIEEDAYTVGCSQASDHGVRSARTEYCYCDRPLCNAAAPHRPPPGAGLAYHTDALAVIVAFNVLKYVRTL